MEVFSQSKIKQQQQKTLPPTLQPVPPTGFCYVHPELNSWDASHALLPLPADFCHPIPPHLRHTSRCSFVQALRQACGRNLSPDPASSLSHNTRAFGERPLLLFRSSQYRYITNCIYCCFLTANKLCVFYHKFMLVQLADTCCWHDNCKISLISLV